MDQVPNISINTEELPTLQRWEIGIVGWTPTPTKLTQPQASELIREVAEVQEEPASEPESQPELDPIVEEDESPTALSP